MSDTHRTIPRYIVRIDREGTPLNCEWFYLVLDRDTDTTALTGLSHDYAVSIAARLNCTSDQEENER